MSINSSTPRIVRGNGSNVIGSDFAKRGQIVGEDQVLRKSRISRVSFLLVLAVLWSGLVVYRLVILQISNPSKWQGTANKQHFQPFRVAEPRAPIVDREGRLLSVSVSAGSIYFRPKNVSSDEYPRIAREIGKITGQREDEILEKLGSDKPFIWLSRQVPRPQAEAVKKLSLPGVDYMPESRRYYPFGDAASSLIGKVGVDGAGLSGLEKVYDLILKGDEANSRFARDGIGNIIEATPAVNVDRLDERDPGSLELTIDAYLQQIVDEELEAGRVKASAAKAMAVLVDADTGDILSMGQAPNTDFNVGAGTADALRNIIAETVYEPGSTIKPIIAAAGLDAGIVGRNEPIDCENGHFYFGKHHINDVHPVGIANLRDIIVRSSNIGIAKVGIRLGAESLYSYITKFGFGQNTGLGLPGETRGILRNVNSWAKVDVATHSFGQGLAVTPLQMVRAISALANGGVLPDLRVVKVEEDDIVGSRVVSSKVANVVRDYLYGVVEDEHGTGTNAIIKGLKVGGKTGTAQKARKDGRGYEEDKYVASFVGFVDGKPAGVDKLLSLIVIIDEPNTDTIYGGTLAAPVFQKIMTRAIKYLGMSKELRQGIDPGYKIAARSKESTDKFGEMRASYDSDQS
jgi:cell division protein FtsI (penicillin-binding protein 3)